MAFTVVHFPERVFEDFEEYRAYLHIKKKVKKRLDAKKSKDIRTIEVLRIINKDLKKKYDEMYQCLLRLKMNS